MIINYLCTDYLWHCVTVYTGTHSAASFAVVTNMTQQLALNERVGNVSSYVYLNHKVLNDPMKSGAFIAQGNAIFPLLPRACKAGESSPPCWEQRQQRVPSLSAQRPFLR